LILKTVFPVFIYLSNFRNRGNDLKNSQSKHSANSFFTKGQSLRKKLREKLIVKTKFNLCRFLAAIRKNFQSTVNFRKIYNFDFYNVNFRKTTRTFANYGIEIYSSFLGRS